MIAGHHAKAVRQAAGARLVVIVSRSDERRRDFAARHGVPFASGRLEELLAREDLDVVSITTPSGAHLEPALAAINAGKHVVVEKPLEITTERVDRMIAAASSTIAAVTSRCRHARPRHVPDTETVTPFSRNRPANSAAVSPVP